MLLFVSLLASAITNPLTSSFSSSALHNTEPEFYRDLRTSASMAQSLWKELGQKTDSLRNLIGLVQRETSTLESLLVTAQRRRNQLYYQCRDPDQAVVFSDVESQSSQLKDHYKVVEPLSVRNASNWRRGDHIKSRSAGAKSIVQSTDWVADDVQMGTMLLLQRARYSVGELVVQVGLKQLTSPNWAAGLVLGFTNAQNFYFAYLDTQNTDCHLRFGLVEKNSARFMKNCSCELNGDGFHELTVVTEPLDFRFYLNQQPLGEVSLDTADYREGGVGLLSLVGATEFGAFKVGSSKISTKLSYSASLPQRDWREEILELYERKTDSSKDAGPIHADGAQSAVKSNGTATLCTTYKPVHIMDEDLRCVDKAFWRLENSVNGTAVVSSFGVKGDDAPQECWLANWRCSESEVQFRMTFETDGEAGAVVRRRSDGSGLRITVETVSQRVRVSHRSAPNGEEQDDTPLFEAVSATPIVAHATLELRIRDLGARLIAFANGAEIADVAVPAKVGPRGSAGFVLRRGAVRLSDLSARGL